MSKGSTISQYGCSTFGGISHQGPIERRRRRSNRLPSNIHPTIFPWSLALLNKYRLASDRPVRALLIFVSVGGNSSKNNSNFPLPIKKYDLNFSCSAKSITFFSIRFFPTLLYLCQNLTTSTFLNHFFFLVPRRIRYNMMYSAARSHLKLKQICHRCLYILFLFSDGTTDQCRPLPP